MPPPNIDIESVYRDSGHVVLRRAMAILGNEAAAQEAVQDIFLSLLRRPQQFAGQSSITTFLYAATTHHCLNALRNQHKRGALLAREGAGRSEGQDAPMVDQILATQLLATLPEKLAKVAVFYYVDEMSQDEIADILGVSRRMVGKLVTKLNQRIQQEAA